MAPGEGAIADPIGVLRRISSNAPSEGHFVADLKFSKTTSVLLTLSR
jgi:hypothetical protein